MTRAVPGRTGPVAVVGAGLSAARGFARTGPFRPRDPVRGTENAVLAGCGTTPGVGVPAVLLSGKPAAARITGGPGRSPAPLTRAQEASA